MKTTIFRKLVLWFGVAVVASFAAFFATTYFSFASRPGGERMFGGLRSMQLEDAVEAYQKGGAPELSKYLKRLDYYLPGDHYLLDRTGKDLVTGQLRSELLVPVQRDSPRRGPGPPFFGAAPGGRGGPPPIMRSDTLDGQFVFIVRNPFLQRYDPSSVLPYYGSILVIILIVAYIFAATLVRPIGRLRESMVRFGAGDLDVRNRSTRSDELGDLAHSFDQMADRIQTLLTAERRLLQDISHELRSPLARLGFAIELARTSSDRGAALDRIKKESNRLSQLVGELIQMTRAEGDPGERVSEVLSLNQVAQTVLDDCAIEAEAKGCTLALHAENEIRIQGDPSLLNRALENIVRNAIRHTPPESVIDVSAGPDEAGWVRLTVRDRGPGVPEELTRDIFRPFFRVDTHRNRESGGVGLGLAIAQRAVLLHHGEISARNAHPGLEVVLRLPVAMEHQTKKASETTAVSGV